MSTNVPITVAHGDGIGREIMEASLHISYDAAAGYRLSQGQ
jgi:isocitrate/isopropylmalate dehydrogenase